MSAAAILMVKDELDVLPYLLPHVAAHVDELIIADNGSTDGTREYLGELVCNGVYPIYLQHDPRVAYYQAEKMTALANLARTRGHSWCVPTDADEVWIVESNPDRRIGDFLEEQPADVTTVTARLYHHFPTDADPPGEPNPLRRIGWREWRVAGWTEERPEGLPKVACRLLRGLQINQGNHSARAPGGRPGLGLAVRHFAWRSPEQYQGKIANGARAYAATSLPVDVGHHWRMFGHPDETPGFEEAVREHYYRWFLKEDPGRDESLVYDPAPVHAA